MESIAKKVFLIFTLIFSTTILNATINSTPSIGGWSSTYSSVSGCSSSPSIIKACVYSISGNTITVQVKRIDNGYFLSSGYVYVRLSTPCGSYLTYTNYNTSMNSVFLTFNASINSGSSIKIYGVTVSSAGSACHSGYITLYNSITPSITVSPSSLSFGSNASSLNFTVNTNVACSISSNNSAFSVYPTSLPANICSGITVTASTNSGSARSGTITISGGGLVRYVSVSQSAGTCITTMYWYSQLNYTNIMGICASTIAQKGCAITCGAMLLTSEISNPSNFTPVTLNTYLTNNYGYSGGCDVYWSKIADADGSGGLVYYSSTNIQNNWAWLDNQLANCRKVIVKVLNSTGGVHYVLVKSRVGSSGIGSSYKCLDPGTTYSQYALKTLANFNNTFYAGYSYSGTWGNGSYKISDEETEEYNVFDVYSFENKIYPNPISNSGILNFEIASNRLQNVPIRVFDLAGRLISEDIQYFGEGPNVGTIKVPENRGFYIVLFSFDDNTSIIKKLIVQ